MQTLRFTTSTPSSMFNIESRTPLVIPKDLSTFKFSETKAKVAYIHGKAEELAGFDIPIFLDGDIAQLDLPINEQDIKMLLPDGEYYITATYQEELCDTCYYLQLKDR